MARPSPLVAALVALVGLGVAHADTIDLPDTRATLALDTHAWHAATKPGLVVAYTTDRGELLAITRAPIPNPDAWRTKTRDAYVDQIEAGVIAAGYQRTAKKLTTIEGVPVLDLEATPVAKSSSARKPLVIRVILFRTYALSLAIEGPRASLSSVRAIAKTFVPPPARAEGSP